MFKLITILCLISIGFSAGVSPCPRQYDVGSVFSGKISFNSAQVIISNLNGLVPLIDGQDTQCYNYSLPYRFARVPQVAIAVH